MDREKKIKKKKGEEWRKTDRRKKRGKGIINEVPPLKKERGR